MHVRTQEKVCVRILVAYFDLNTRVVFFIFQSGVLASECPRVCMSSGTNLRDPRSRVSLWFSGSSVVGG